MIYVFFFHCTEKKIFAYIKLFEAIFDSGENKYANPYIYNTDSLKLALLCYFIDKINDSIAFDFYENCLMTSNLDSSINRFICICSNISEKIKQGENKLINLYIDRVLSGAKASPQELSLFSEKKNYDSPNLFDWLPIMREISIYSIVKHAQIHKIIHDYQEQFKRDLSETFTMFTRLLPIPSDVFEIKKSSQSYGLQMVDVCLYTYTHKNLFSNKQNTLKLYHFINERCHCSYTNLDVLKKQGSKEDLYNYIAKKINLKDIPL